LFYLYSFPLIAKLVKTEGGMDAVVNSVIPAESDNVSATADNSNHDSMDYDDSGLSALRTACNDAFQTHRFPPLTLLAWS